MNLFKSTVFAFILIPAVLFSSTSAAALSCGVNERAVIYNLGVSHTSTTVPPLPGAGAPGGTGTATDIFNNWVYLDAQGHSITAELNIDLSNGGSISKQAGVSDASILPSTDILEGRIDLEMCVPNVVTGGLSHPLYYDGGSLIGATSVSFHIHDGHARAVGNASSYREVAGEFNNTNSVGSTGEAYLANIIKSHVGVNVSAIAAQEAFTFALGFTSKEPAKELVQATNEFKVFVEGNKLIVTGANASVNNTNAVTRVEDKFGGSQTVNGNKLVNLDTKTGTTYVQKTATGNIPFTILEGRGDLNGENSYTCDAGENVTLQAGLARNSLLAGNISLYDNFGGLIKEVEKDNLFHAVACVDATYQITGHRTSPRGYELEADTLEVTVKKNVQTQTVLTGVDIDGDGKVDVLDADRNGELDSVIDIDCNFPFTYDFDLIPDPLGQHTYFGGSMPQGMSLGQATGTIVYDAPCSDAGQTFSTSWNADNGPELGIQFRVR